jgi:sulfatase maturation enzyme AslB (radical SAM superfamily)
MTGAMAGSTATVFSEHASQLEVLTLTINNQCSLSCPHCYLQYAGLKVLIDRDLVEVVLRARYRHLALVGKEPFFDKKSVMICEELARGCRTGGKTISVITNGFGIGHLCAEVLQILEWVDVSFDGGPMFYKMYRRGSYAKLIAAVKGAQVRGLRQVNALNTVSSSTLPFIDDMMEIASETNWCKIIFSPFTSVRNDGKQTVSSVPIEDVLQALASSDAFLACDNAYFLLGAEAAIEEGLSCDDVRCLVEQYELQSKTVQVACDPLLLGYLRLTYDGLVLTPYQSLHPSDYGEQAKRLEQYGSIENAFQELRAF